VNPDEATFQACVVEVARLAGWRTLHIRPARRADGSWRTPIGGDGKGWPDLTLVRPPRLLFVGRMVEKKGLPDLVAACALLRARGFPVECRLVGAGPLEPALREQVRTLGLETVVEFREPASQEEVALAHLPAASAFVLPCRIASDGDRDGLPTTLLEAMARGVPVVSTRLPGIPEAVPDGEAGLLAEPGDVSGLADAIVRTLGDRAGARKRARFARQHVERLFDARRNVGELSETFRNAALSRGSMEARSR